ncbi:MAG: DUF1365 domain-containing protein [Rhodospirillaceae bacterium]|nr:DUF1365 domain-containing protein [Rhodospirillaceae bacterium]|tara:strand:+ start:4084 stop:4884 length:801 start_codon:yes stop_codon:yes gene_type:complete
MRGGGRLYFGEVVHERERPRRHRLRYRVFSMLVDVDQLGAMSASDRLFSYNRPGLFSIHDKDHGDKCDSSETIPQWVRKTLDEHGLDAGKHRIQLLCYPRILGYVFNPLSVYFCYAQGGALCAIIYEVHNTYGERHAYVISVDDESRSVIRQQGNKEFFVSPFIPMECEYKFRIQPPDEHVRIAMRVEDSEGLLLTASFNGVRKPLDDRHLAWAFVRFPLMTVKVILGIHWEALKLWRKKIPFLDHSAPTAADTTDISTKRKLYVD